MTVEVTPAAETADTPQYPIACLGADPGTVTWFQGELDGLESIAWEGGAATQTATTLEAWVAAAREAITLDAATRVHLLTTGPAAYGAITLAARHPHLVASLLLGDPDVDPETAGYAETLADVQAPTLVIASAPDPGHATEHAQSIAGGITDGVFVIIDGAQIPAHRERGSSFNEWAVAFTLIAEGLAETQAMAHQYATDSKEEDRA